LFKMLSSIPCPPKLEPRTRVAVAAEYVLVVIDKDRRRRRPLAEHAGFSRLDGRRSVLNRLAGIPSTVVLLRRWNWWPSRLAAETPLVREAA
jgi:hypothetical protein